MGDLAANQPLMGNPQPV